MLNYWEHLCFIGIIEIILAKNIITLAAEIEAGVTQIT
jgi:hypothetical protein